MAAQICTMLADGMSLRRICNASGMPGKTTVFRWLIEHRDFRDQYARAREAQADALFDEIIDIADEVRLGTKKKVTSDGDSETVTVDMVERTRLQIEARKWVIGKLRPKVYGPHPEEQGASGATKEQLLKQLAEGLPD